jgi:hypothetical protein
VKVFVPVHLTPDWITRDIARERDEREAGRAVVRTKYIRPKHISIRQFIARSEKLKQTL